MSGYRVPGNVWKRNEQRSCRCRSLTHNCDITCVLINRRFNKKLSNHEENYYVVLFHPFSFYPAINILQHTLCFFFLLLRINYELNKLKIEKKNVFLKKVKGCIICFFFFF